MVMDARFESELLSLVDDALNGNRGYDAFADLRKRLGDKYVTGWNSATYSVRKDVRTDTPLSAYSEEALEVAALEQLAEGRRSFFRHVLERASWTTWKPVSVQDRQDGWISGEEFYQLLEDERTEYRRRFLA
jgi:hypothetical protein